MRESRGRNPPTHSPDTLTRNRPNRKTKTMNAKKALIVEIAIATIPAILGTAIYLGIVWEYMTSGYLVAALTLGMLGAFLFAALAGVCYDMMRDSVYAYYVKTGQTRKADRFTR